MSNNVNEVIRAVLNSFFFYKKILQAPKSPKAPKAQRRNQAKAKNATSEQKSLKNILRGKKSLIRSFAFLCFLCARRKENRKKRNVSTMLSIGAVR